STRKEFIMAKYMERKYVHKAGKEDYYRLQEAIFSGDLLALLQAFAEGHDLTKPLISPEGQEQGELPLHLAVRCTSKSSLPLVDFIIQNGGNLDGPTPDGNTALHYGAQYNQPNCLKLLLKGKASINAVNAAGETPLDVARKYKNAECEDLVSPLQWSFGSSPSPTTGQPALFAHNQRSCTGMDISNRTYEAVLVPSRPGPRRSNSEEIPPPLPIKKPIRAGVNTKPEQSSVESSEPLPQQSDIPDVQSLSITSGPGMLDSGMFRHPCSSRNSVEVKGTAYWETRSEMEGGSQRRRSEPNQIMVQQPSPGTSPDKVTPVKFRWDLELTVRDCKEDISYVNTISEQLVLHILERTANILDYGLH
ncbi:UNVERIFIED_CONTAM: hypothetical protein K2H54_053711, partial [Gekko kuhli]